MCMALWGHACVPQALEAEMAELHDTDTTESESEDEAHAPSDVVVEVQEDEVWFTRPY